MLEHPSLVTTLLWDALSEDFALHGDAFVYSKLKDGRFPAWPKYPKSLVADNTSGGFRMILAMPTLRRDTKKLTRVAVIATVLLLTVGTLSGCAGGSGSSSADTTPPTAPASLTATAASGTQISLSWTASTDNVGVTGYRVERCQGSGCSNFAQIATPAATSFNDSGLLASIAYSYRVRATDAAGNLSGYSNTASATTQGDDSSIRADQSGGHSCFQYADKFVLDGLDLTMSE